MKGTFANLLLAAAPVAFAWPKTTPVCSQYGPLVSILKNYPPAESFCSSKYPVAPSTTTVAAPTTTYTSTTSTSVTVTAAPATITAIVTSMDTVVLTMTETDTETQTVTAIATSVETMNAPAKRGAAQNPTQVQWSSLIAQEQSKISTFCSCIETPKTVTATTTPSTTITVTNSITQTLFPTVTTTSTSIQTVTSVTTTTTTTTTTATQTLIDVIAVTMTSYPMCTGPPFNGETGVQGCSANCYCDSEAAGDGTMGFCDMAVSCGSGCDTSSDCPIGSQCAGGHGECGYSNGNTCLSTSGCTSSLSSSKRSAARDFPGLDVEMDLEGRDVIMLLRNSSAAA